MTDSKECSMTTSLMLLLLNTSHLYNIVKTGDYTYNIELALAGFGKKDIDVSYEDSMVTVKPTLSSKTDDPKEGVLHRGISKRQSQVLTTLTM